MMDDDFEQPLHECLSLTEYVKICKEYLTSCFDENDRIIRKNDLLNVETNIRAALEVLDDIDNAEWVVTSSDDEDKSQP